MSRPLISSLNWNSDNSKGWVGGRERDCLCRVLSSKNVTSGWHKHKHVPFVCQLSSPPYREELCTALGVSLSPFFFFVHNKQTNKPTTFSSLYFYAVSISRASWDSWQLQLPWTLPLLLFCISIIVFFFLTFYHNNNKLILRTLALPPPRFPHYVYYINLVY